MKLFSPAAERNKAPFAEVLRNILPETGLVLEIAGGSGQHAAFMAAHFPGLEWQTTERDERELASMRAYRQESDLANYLPPMRLDVFDVPWRVLSADAIVCMNMVHISPWEATLRLLEGAADVLRDGGVLCLYGPYRRTHEATVPSNEQFDASLRQRDPSWGLRVLEDVAKEAKVRALELQVIHPMPANNLTVVFRRTHGLSDEPTRCN